jgi:hypothetical protein
MTMALAPNYSYFYTYISTQPAGIALADKTDGGSFWKMLHIVKNVQTAVSVIESGCSVSLYALLLSFIRVRIIIPESGNLGRMLLVLNITGISLPGKMCLDFASGMPATITRTAPDVPVICAAILADFTGKLLIRKRKPHCRLGSNWQRNFFRSIISDLG